MQDDRYLKIVCDECGGETAIHSGEVVCKGCGLVLEAVMKATFDQMTNQTSQVRTRARDEEEYSSFRKNKEIDGIIGRFAPLGKRNQLWGHIEEIYEYGRKKIVQDEDIQVVINDLRKLVYGYLAVYLKNRGMTGKYEELIVELDTVSFKNMKTKGANIYSIIKEVDKKFELYRHLGVTKRQRVIREKLLPLKNYTHQAVARLSTMTNKVEYFDAIYKQLSQSMNATSHTALVYYSTLRIAYKITDDKEINVGTIVKEVTGYDVPVKTKWLHVVAEAFYKAGVDVLGAKSLANSIRKARIFDKKQSAIIEAYVETLAILKKGELPELTTVVVEEKEEKSVTVQLNGTRWKKYGLVNINKQIRTFFPAIRERFVIQTEGEEFETYVTSTMGLEPEIDGKYISKGMKGLFKKYPELEAGDNIVFVEIVPKKKYKIKIMKAISLSN